MVELKSKLGSFLSDGVLCAQTSSAKLPVLKFDTIKVRKLYHDVGDFWPVATTRTYSRYSELPGVVVVVIRHYV